MRRGLRCSCGVNRSNRKDNIKRHQKRCKLSTNYWCNSLIEPCSLYININGIGVEICPSFCPDFYFKAVNMHQCRHINNNTYVAIADQENFGLKKKSKLNVLNVICFFHES
jgi:hypothetical protein